MIVVAHRRNTLEALAATPRHQGVEVDVRSGPRGLIVAHDPFEDGPAFEGWLLGYDHALLIVNVKEEGLLRHVAEALKGREIGEWFVLGAEPSEMVFAAAEDVQHCAVRVSEHHPVDAAVNWSGQVRWVWLDSFTGQPPDPRTVAALAGAGLNVCAVSAELYGRPKACVASERSALQRSGLVVDAVCTRLPQSWADDSA